MRLVMFSHFLQMNGTNDAGKVPPEHIAGDYIEIAYLACVLTIGTPINIFILRKLFRERKQAQENSIKVQKFFEVCMVWI